MPWGAALAVGGSLIAGSMQADAAGDAADAQSRSADKADATQRYQYDTTRADNAPFRESGVAANNRLSYLLGLPSTDRPTSGNSLAGQRLIDMSGGAPQYNTDLYNSNAAYKSAWDDVAKFHYNAQGRDYNQYSDGNWIEQQLRNRLGNQITQDTQSANAAAQNDPAHGSLLRNFSATDLNADPVYQSGLQFGLDEGTKGINRMAAASGSSLSGATEKAIIRYANDYGSTKANEAFNRFNVNRDSTYNKLAGLSGAGQQATNQVSAAGTNMANNVSNNALYAGSVRGASAIAQGNALTGAMNNIYGIGKKKGWWDTGSGNAFQPNANGIGGNPYEGFDALANGGWGIE